MIIGFNKSARKLAEIFEEEGVNTQLMGFVEDRANVKELTHYPILSDVRSAVSMAADLEVQEIFSTIGPEQNKYIYTLMDEAEKKCVRFKIVPDLNYFFRRHFIVDYIRGIPILSARPEPMEDINNKLLKRAFDVVVSSIVLLFILSWLIPLLGLIILLQSKGPVFFSQLRTGKNDRPFSCLKFRSMKLNNDSDKVQATKNDSRLTKIGAFIRKTSLDEFPQFINVLKGDMSIVGPRPHMLKHTNDYSKIVNHYMVRQFLKPGITGWAQINSYRGEIKNTQQLKLRIESDLWYLENWSLWLDVKIIFLTVYRIFRTDKNAY